MVATQKKKSFPGETIQFDLRIFLSRNLTPKWPWIEVNYLIGYDIHLDLLKVLLFAIHLGNFFKAFLTILGKLKYVLCIVYIYLHTYIYTDTHTCVYNYIYMIIYLIICIHTYIYVPGL